MSKFLPTTLSSFLLTYWYKQERKGKRIVMMVMHKIRTLSCFLKSYHNVNLSSYFFLFLYIQIKKHPHRKYPNKLLLHI